MPASDGRSHAGQRGHKVTTARTPRQVIALDANLVFRLLVADDPAQTRRALRALPNVATTSPTDVARALDAAGKGMDIADTFHIALANPDAETFVTFDRKVVGDGARLRIVRLA